jgi:hypothetical protein
MVPKIIELIQNNRKCVDVVQIFENLAALTGIQFSQSAMEEFRREPNSFRFVDPDVLAVEATVKYMNLIEHSSAVVLYYEASRNLGRESSRYENGNQVLSNVE